MTKNPPNLRFTCYWAVLLLAACAALRFSEAFLTGFASSTHANRKQIAEPEDLGLAPQCSGSDRRICDRAITHGQPTFPPQEMVFAVTDCDDMDEMSSEMREEDGTGPFDVRGELRKVVRFPSSVSIMAHGSHAVGLRSLQARHIRLQI